MGIGIKLKTRLSRLLSNIRGCYNNDRDLSKDRDIVNKDNKGNNSFL